MGHGFIPWFKRPGCLKHLLNKGGLDTGTSLSVMTLVLDSS